MNCSPKRSSVLALAISGLVLTSATGCGDGDQRAADKEIRANVATALESRRVSSPKGDGVNAALAELNKADKSAASASPVGKITARANLAEVELEAGRREARALAQIEPQISQTLWEIALLGGQIDRLSAATAAGAKGTPDATLKAIADKRAEMVAAGEAASRKAAEIQGEIDKVKAQVAQLTQQKDAAANEADTLSDKASKANGKEASDLADQATEARRKAGHAGHDVDKASAALLPLERDLAVEQAKKKTADEAVATLDQDKASIDAAWQALQARGNDQKQLTAKLGQDLATKGQRLDELTKQAAAARQKAIEYFTKSAQHAAAAASDANTLARDLTTWGNNFPTEKKAFDQLKSTYGANTFKLSEAEAQNEIANLHNEHALLLQYQQQVATGLAKVVQEAGITMPPALSAGADEQKKAADAASAAYTEAATKYMDVYQGSSAPKELQNTAHVSRMLALYGQYVAGDKSKLADARQEYTETFAENKSDPIIRLLPPELRGEAVPTAPAPGTAAPTPGTPAPAGTPTPRGAAPAPAPTRTTPAPTTPTPGAQDLNK